MPTPNLKHCNMGTGITPPASTPSTATTKKVKRCSQLGNSQSQRLVTRIMTENSSPMTRNKVAKFNILMKPFSASKKKN